MRVRKAGLADKPAGPIGWKRDPMAILRFADPERPMGRRRPGG
jgi:hypothetical protein